MSRFCRSHNNYNVVPRVWGKLQTFRMSLTSFINIPDVRRKFREEFPRCPVPWKNEPLAPPRTANYALVGTAFDYLFRFYLKKLNPKAKTSHWVAERVPALLARDKKAQKKATKIVAEAKRTYRRYLKNGKIDLSLLKSVLLLAGLDPIFRAGRGHDYIGKVDAQDVDDIRSLISLVDSKLFKGKTIVRLNPTFGEGSWLVGGGDADVLIDNMLIDIKTTKQLKVRRDTYNQLIGYYTLAAIGGIDGVPPNHRIDKLAIYFSRFGELLTFDVSDVINAKSFPSFVKWFQNRADQYLHTSVSNK